MQSKSALFAAAAALAFSGGTAFAAGEAIATGASADSPESSVPRVAQRHVTPVPSGTGNHVQVAS